MLPGRVEVGQDALPQRSTRFAIVFIRKGSAVLTITVAGRDLKRVARPRSDVGADIRVFSPDWQPRPRQDNRH